MLTRTLATLTSLLLFTAAAGAQETKPVAPEKSPEPVKARAADDAKPINVKLDFTITDQSGTGEPGKRTVSMIVADRRSGMIRTGGSVVMNGQRYNVTLNIDARPALIEDNRVLLEIGLEYMPKPMSESATTGEGRANLNQQLSMIVVPGKPTVVSQASDPTSDRRISVELTATVLK